MANLIKIAFVAIAVLALLHGSSAINCYQCKNCTDVEKETSKNCTDKGATGCYIVGSPKEENWTRGCAPEKKSYCVMDDTDDFACSFCQEDDCNSGNFLVGSVVLSIGVAAILRILH